jgi:hypothetical protein
MSASSKERLTGLVALTLRFLVCEGVFAGGADGFGGGGILPLSPATCSFPSLLLSFADGDTAVKGTADWPLVVPLGADASGDCWEGAASRGLFSACEGGTTSTKKRHEKNKSFLTFVIVSSPAVVFPRPIGF